MSHAKNPVIIGLCGRSGSGKSFVSKLFSAEGIPSVDTDAVYREMTAAPVCGELSECMAELTGEFGTVILCEDMSLNRRALADIVFSEDGKDRLKKLNGITHRHILRETDRRISELGECGFWAVIVDAPLLFESGYHEKCDYIVAATAPDDVLIGRITRRDVIDVDAAARRLKVQLSDSELRSRADFVIDTDTDEETLRLRVREISGKIMSQVKGC
ncbi:MAG: dephospho-CoA kinase [Clostridia bacterium]|nr:dephospho-CoA kinase [Clostridia bacterium]